MTAFRLLLSAAPDFGKLALDELARAAPGAEAQLLAPGLWGISGAGFDELAPRWRSEPPIFVRHIAPVQHTQPLPETAAELQALSSTLAELVASAAAGLQGSFSVQTRAPVRPRAFAPFELTSAVAERIAALTPLRLDVRAPEHVLSLLLHERHVYAGFSRAQDNLSNWAGGAPRYAREPEQLSRAEFKLLEALDSFAAALPPGGRALDLGAAPGGWTRVLVARGQRVVAVDPARLHPSLSRHERVQHERTSAERFLARASGPFDVILNDIRKDARESAELLRQCAPLLERRGFALLTLKLRHERRAEQIAGALRVLRSSFALCQARHLFHNRSEVSVYLRHAPDG